MKVINYVNDEYYYFKIDLGDGEARICLSSSISNGVTLSLYGVGHFTKKDVYYVDFIKVTPKYRNFGYGSALLTSLIEWADKYHFAVILDAIPLDTDIETPRLVNFYKRHGFLLVPYKDNVHSMYYFTGCNKTKDEQHLEKT